MDEKMSNALRAPFAPEFVGQLPRISCAVCKKAPSKVCPSHKKIECKVCGNFITSAHLHLPFVGHADVTNRLLLVDPEWTYEPMTVDEFGRPGVSRSLNGQHALWIRMTVGGVTRLGVGLVPVDSDDIEKQLISDAIRNAAMRFGVALDLWSKAGRLESAPTTASENSVEPSVDVAPKVQSAVAPISGETTVSKTDVVSYSPIVGELEPMPEYCGDGEDYDGYFESEHQDEVVLAPTPSEVVTRVATPAPSGGSAPAMDSQKAAIRRCFESMEMPTQARASYIGKVVGRDVGRLDELSRSEASKVLKCLMVEQDSERSVLVAS